MVTDQQIPSNQPIFLLFRHLWNGVDSWSTKMFVSWTKTIGKKSPTGQSPSTTFHYKCDTLSSNHWNQHLYHQTNGHTNHRSNGRCSECCFESKSNTKKYQEKFQNYYTRNWWWNGRHVDELFVECHENTLCDWYVEFVPNLGGR